MSTELALECPPVATLLTGVGYIGATLIRRLVERGAAAAPIVALDNFFSTSREHVLAALPPGVQLIEGDVAEPSAVARAFDAASADDLVVYHLAAQPSAGIAATDPGTTERSNLVGARVVLEAARARSAQVVFGGSFRVYGDDIAGQTVDEETPYGRVGDLSHLSKIYVEQLARMIGGRFISVRLGVTYGLSPIMKTTRQFMTVPNLFCSRAARGEALQVLEDRPVGFIHVCDAAEALLLAGDRLAGHEQAWEVVNAAPEVATIGQVARHVQRLAGERGVEARIEGAAAASEASFFAPSRLQDNGFTASRQLGEGLGEVLDFFRDGR
jgi:nucleoside-diphosphate-sugar epimerase